MISLAANHEGHVPLARLVSPCETPKLPSNSPGIKHGSGHISNGIFWLLDMVIFLCCFLDFPKIVTCFAHDLRILSHVSDTGGSSPPQNLVGHKKHGDDLIAHHSQGVPHRAQRRLTPRVFSGAWELIPWKLTE